MEAPLSIPAPAPTRLAIPVSLDLHRRRRLAPEEAGADAAALEAFLRALRGALEAPPSGVSASVLRFAPRAEMGLRPGPASRAGGDAASA